MKHSPNPYLPVFFETYAEENGIKWESHIEELVDNARWFDDDGADNLKYSIFRIKSNSLSFVETGLLAYKIQVKRLWSKSYKNFQDFCKRALGVESWQIKRTIEAARVVMELVAEGFNILPKNESQCRPLWKILLEEGTEALVEAWEKVTKLKPHQITEKSICEVLNIQKKETKLQKVLNKLREKAIEEGLSLAEYLEENLLLEGKQTKEIEEEKIEEWEEDVKQLVKEHDEHDREKKVSSFFTSTISNVWYKVIEGISNIFPPEYGIAYSQ
jgi:hypothetical protein